MADTDAVVPAGGTGDSSGTPVADGAGTSTVPEAERNAYLLKLISVHPFTQFDEREFLDLLQNSLSLNVFEKKRVIDAIPTISQFQVDELKKVFTDEREEFRKLMPTEGHIIREYLTKAKKEWIQLYEIYMQEVAQREKQSEETGQIDDLKKSLGL